MPKIAIIDGKTENEALLPFFNKHGEFDLLYVPSRPVPPGTISGTTVLESLEQLLQVKDLTLVINGSKDPQVKTFLNKHLNRDTEVISGTGDRLLYTLLEEKLKALTENKKSLKHHKDIYGLGILLNSAMSTEEVTTAILDCATRLTDTPAGSLVTYNKQSHTMHLTAARGFSKKFSQVKEWPVRKGGLTDYLMRQREPVVISDVIKEHSFDNPVMLEEGIRSVMAVTLSCEQEIIGILYVDDYRPRTFSEEEKTELALLANHAAFGLQKAALLEELSQTKDYMEAVLQNSPDMIITTDQNTNIVEFNPGAESMLGYKKEEIIGTSVESFYPDFNERRSLMKKVKKHSKVINHETKLKTKKGKLLDISLSLSQLKDKNGKVLGTVGISKDITQQKKLEAQLQAANEKLQKKIEEVKKIDKMKSDFLSIVSHELRTPLTSIIGFSKMILRRFTKDIMPTLPGQGNKATLSAEKIKENLEIVVSEGNRLSRLINNLLDLAKIEEGKIDWNIVRCSLEEICRSAINAVQSLAEEKQLPIRLEADPQLPQVEVDHDRMIQVVTNLFSNAIKFTDTGSVTCRIRNMGDFVEVRIIDTGIGIKAEDLQKVFEKFKQVGDTLTNRPKGTGLGLPICKEIVEFHGGRIWVESTYGKGSQFVFTLKPLHQALPISLAKPKLLQEVRDKLYSQMLRLEKGQTILVVDDESNIRSLLRQELEDAGYKVIEALDGSQALARARADKPDLIILDILMPGIDGFDVMTILKNDTNTANIPILIYSIIEDRERGYRLGADDYITKSDGAETLLNKVSSLVAVPRHHQKKVLLIEQDESVAGEVSETLREKGYQVFYAKNGDEGIAIAKQEAPDLVIVDGELSRQNDNKILKSLKNNAGTERASIIVLTSDFAANGKALDNPWPEK